MRQSDLSLIAGKRYRITAWVRGENVVGSAGWYAHVATANDPMKLNLLKSAGDGTFDWRLVTLEFTAPPGATGLSHGSVLRGTGIAWFDDVTVECLDPTPVAVTVESREDLDIKEIGPGRLDYV